MAFNGSGTFVRLYNWVTDKANGIFVRADRMDNEMDGFATGLTNCVTRDGQSPALADLPMGGFKLTGLANGVAATDAATVGQLSGAGTYFNIGNSGTGVTVDFDTNGPDQQVTLTNNATLTLADGGANPISATLKIIQDGTGGRTITWAGANYSASRWINAAAAPVLSPVLSTTEFVDFYWDGTIWFQQHRGSVARQSVYTTLVNRGGSTQSISGAATKIQFTTALVDPYSEWDVVTNYRWTPKVTGLYLVHLSSYFSGSSANNNAALIKVAGTTVAAAFISPVVVSTQYTLSVTYLLNVTSLGQYVEGFFFATAGTTTILDDPTGNRLSVTRLGDAY